LILPTDQNLLVALFNAGHTLLVPKEGGAYRHGKPIAALG
jgi:hypothetical protein